jgi:hypothetical protein
MRSFIGPVRPIAAAALAVLLTAGAAMPAGAIIYRPLAFGDQMEGGTLTVTFATAGSVVANIVAGAGVQEGFAQVANWFTFSVAGDTFTNVWSLTNNTAAGSQDFIVSALFDLNGSISFFDDNSNPSAPFSAEGRLGAQRVAGPAILASGELQQVTPPDMYKRESITWGGGFGAGVASTWLDDTDVPEPGVLSLLGLGLAGSFYTRKRARKAASV